MLAVKVVDLEKRVSKRGNIYGVLSVIDLSGNANITIFESTIAKLEGMDLNEPIVLSGKVDSRDSKKEFRAFDVLSLEDAKQAKIRLKYQKDDDSQEDASQIIPIHIDPKSLGFWLRARDRAR